MAKYKWYKHKKEDFYTYKWTDSETISVANSVSLTPEILEAAWTAVYDRGNRAWSEPVITISEPTYSSIVSAYAPQDEVTFIGGNWTDSTDAAMYTITNLSSDSTTVTYTAQEVA